MLGGAENSCTGYMLMLGCGVIGDEVSAADMATPDGVDLRSAQVNTVPVETGWSGSATGPAAGDSTVLLEGASGDTISLRSPAARRRHCHRPTASSRSIHRAASLELTDVTLFTACGPADRAVRMLPRVQRRPVIPRALRAASGAEVPERAVGVLLALLSVPWAGLWAHVVAGSRPLAAAEDAARTGGGRTSRVVTAPVN